MPLALFTTLRELGFRWRNCVCTPHTQALPRLLFHQGFCLIKKQFTVGRTWPLTVSRKHHSWAPRVISLHMVHKIQSFAATMTVFSQLHTEQEGHSCYFHHNWLQNISKMSEFRRRVCQVSRVLLECSSLFSAPHQLKYFQTT